MKTKFVKVSVKDCNPEKDVTVIGIGETEEVSRMVLQESGYWYSLDHECECDEPEFLIIEVPDREDEMREIIQEMILELNPATLSGDYENLIKKAKQLLNK